MKQKLPRSLQRIVLQPHQCDSPLQKSAPIALTPAQQHYLYKVLRLDGGAEFMALSGKGQWWRAALQPERGLALLVEEIPIETELPITVTLTVAMPKGNGMEDIIRQATELGVSCITPVWSDRTVIKSGTSLGAQKLERWQRIASEATEQSLRACVPEVALPQPFSDLVKSTAAEDKDGHYSHKYICVTHADAPHLLSQLQKSLLPSISTPTPSSLLIATGPEGGWTQSEESLAIAHSFQPVFLGNRILAAVTAPVVALAIVSAVFNARDYP